MKKIFLFLIVSVTLFSFASPILAAATPIGGACTQDSDCASPGKCKDDGTGSKKCTDPGFGVTLVNPLCIDGSGGSKPCISDFPGLIKKITTYVSSIVGSIAVIIFLYAGFLYLTSAGSPEKISKAHRALIYAIVGVGIALAGTGLVVVIEEVVGTGP